MSKIDVEYGLDDILKSKDRVVVLFYASWCPFSQRFLPIFEKYAQSKTQTCVQVKTDVRQVSVKSIPWKWCPQCFSSKKGKSKNG